MRISTILWRYILFVSLFIGTGFVAGSIVHFGEGVTAWDVSVLCIGIILFTAASIIQEYTIEKKPFSVGGALRYICLSLTLAISIGMASGGFQHFIDTPQYSATLIPIGLSIGMLSFVVRQRYSLSMKTWMMLCISVIFCAYVLWHALLTFNAMLPDSLRHGHGSHVSYSTQVEVPTTTSGSSPIYIPSDHHDH